MIKDLVSILFKLVSAIAKQIKWFFTQINIGFQLNKKINSEKKRSEMRAKNNNQNEIY